MDADRKLSEREAEQALKDLFRSNGVANAPEGLEARIMQRIMLSTKPAMIPEQGLIPTWVWVVGGLGSLGLVVYLNTVPTGSTGTGPVEHVLSLLPLHSLGAVLTSQWILMGATSLGLLLALDLTLRRTWGSAVRSGK